MNFLKLESSIEKLIDLIVLKLPSVAIGLLILFVGKYIIRFAVKLINNRFDKRHVDMSIRTFISSIVRFVLWVLLILTAANTMGIQTTSFIAALSAFGLAVGLAMQGSLSNFAGGVLILLFRPFDVDDYIDSASGSSGTVEKIDLLYTTIINDDGIRIFSPNGTLANSVIKNYSKIKTRRMQFKLNVSYDINMKVARETILGILTEDKRVLDTPAPSVNITDISDSGMTLLVLAWAKKEDFWATKFEMAEKIQGKVDGVHIILAQSTLKVLGDDK